LFLQGEKGYGKLSEDIRVKEEDVKKIDMSVFDKKDLRQLQMKTLISFGSCFGFCGSQEHTFLKKDQIGNGHYADDHPAFPGYEWWGLNRMNNDKTQVLSLRNGHVRDMQDFGSFPVLSDGVNGDVACDIGGAIKRLFLALPDDGCDCFYRRISKDGKKFTKAPLGKDSIRNVFREGFNKLGISNYETLRPHALCALFITALANDSSVNQAENLACSRHLSVSANVRYQKRSSESDANRIKCQLSKIPATKKQD
jgi:hypothetical protein